MTNKSKLYHLKSKCMNFWFKYARKLVTLGCRSTYITWIYVTGWSISPCDVFYVFPRDWHFTTFIRDKSFIKNVNVIYLAETDVLYRMYLTDELGTVHDSSGENDRDLSAIDKRADRALLHSPLERWRTNPEQFHQPR